MRVIETYIVLYQNTPSALYLTNNGYWIGSTTNIYGLSKISNEDAEYLITSAKTSL